MFRAIIDKLFGWKKPDLGYSYKVVRTSRDVFQVSLGQRILSISAEVGEKKNGKYEIAVFPRTLSAGNDGTPISPREAELAVTLEQFLSANGYVPHRA